MTSLKQLITTELYDSDEKIGAITNLLVNKSNGKCSLILENGVYDADKLSKSGNKLKADGLRKREITDDGILGKPAYDAEGKARGKIADVFFTQTLTLTKLICDNGDEIKRSQLQAAGDAVLIKQPKTPSVKKNASKKITSKPAAETKKTEPINEKEDAVITESSKTYPVKRRYGDFSFLLGKTADKNITNFYNEIMLKKGETVTAEILKQAKIYGKLIELCLHVK